MFEVLLKIVPEAATGGVLWKKMFLKTSQNSQQNTCTRASFLMKLLAWSLQLYEKRGSSTGVFLGTSWNAKKQLL